MTKTRYYPGFLGALFLVLLRTAIGWHFLTEGLWKVLEKDGKPFTAEPYLRASAGPLADRFRNIVPDVDAKDRLRRDPGGRPIGLKQFWADQLDSLATHYRFDEAQRRRAQASLDTVAAQADAWFLNQDNADTVLKYLDQLAEIEAVQHDPNVLASQREAATKTRKEAETTRRQLTSVIDEWSSDLHAQWNAPGLITDQQKATFGAPKPPLTQLEIVNLATKWGLTIVGACLLTGFLTPLAGLAGAALLLMFYLSQPPFPGLPEPPNVEGHYLYVNKNLIELFACLFIAVSGCGRWIGLDALFFGPRRERGAAPQAHHLIQPDQSEPPGSQPSPTNPERPRGSTNPRQPIPLG